MKDLNKLPPQKMSFEAFMRREDKKIIRRRILGERKKFFEENYKEFKNASNSIMDKLLTSKEYKEAKVIMCFVSFKDEVMTHNIIKTALKDGKILAVPYVEKGNKEMVAAKIENFNELKEGFYGILAPLKDKLNIMDPKDIDLVISPGVAFDKEGYRVGYGGGFYDRFLKNTREDVKIIALGFDLQVIDEAPRGPFDIPVHGLITESGIFNFLTKNW